MKKTIMTLLVCGCALLAHAQYTIYPVPQTMTPNAGKATFSPTVTVICDAQIDQATKDRAQQVLTEHQLNVTFASTAPASGSTLYLRVDGSLEQTGRFDAHTLVLAQRSGNATVTITGQHSDATFMGLASLEQMLDAEGTDDLPCVTINDYADQQQRGLVEGYYGYPYSIEVKKDLMRYMMRHKMNSYMYGAKSEPYHHSKWRQAYPTEITPEQQKNGYLTQEMVRDICRTSAKTKVNFIWSIHPGNDFLNSDAAITDIMAKYQMMYDLGVRQFGLFVDDVSIPSSQADMEKNAQRVTQLQQAIDDRWNGTNSTPESRVKPLNFVPQIYCRGFAGSEEQYRDFFTALSQTPQKVIIYTTGGGVWSVPNAGDFNQPKQYLGRDVAWWWNYPCNDNADSRIYPMDMYSNFADMPAVNGGAHMDANLSVGIGIVANPMQQGEVAKIPLFSVADYAWNASGFRNMESWEASFDAILDTQEKVDALKGLAPYLTYNDPQGWIPAATTDASNANIATTLSKIATIKDLANSPIESDTLLWRDLTPWVGKLEQMLHAGNSLIRAKDSEVDRDTRWTNYVDGAKRYVDANTNEDFIAYTLEGMNATVGTPHLAQPSERYFGPYLATLRNTAVQDLIPARSRYAAAYTNTQAQIRAVTNAQGAYLSMNETILARNEYVGIALFKPTRIAQLLVANDIAQRFAVSTSPDGRTWSALPNGATTVNGYVKYVKIENTSSESQSLTLTANNLKLTPYSMPTYVDLTAPTTNDYNSRNNINDGDVTNFWSPRQNQAHNDIIRLNYSAPAPVKSVRFVIHKDDVMQRGRIEVGMTADGDFTPLKKKGTDLTSFTVNDMTPLHADGTPYAAGESTQGAYIYEIVMDGEGLVGQYVRFYNEQANTGRWIRVAEFTTEFDSEASPCEAYPELCDGQAYTSVLIPAGTTINYDPQTAYPIDRVEVFTENGIEQAHVDNDGVIRLTYGQDTRVYEVVAYTDEPIGGVFSTSAEKATYYGLKFQTGNVYLSENANDANGLIRTTTEMTNTWAFVGSDNGFKILSNTGQYLGVKNVNGTDYCYTLSSADQATDFVFINDNGTTIEIARSGINGNSFNPWGGNSAGKNIGFWNANSQNNKLVLVEVEQPELPEVEDPEPTAQAVFPICVPVDQPYTNAHGRKLKSITVSTASTGTQRIECDETRVYNDLTQQCIYAKRGEDITVSFDYNGKDWMNSYIYIDRDHNHRLTPDLSPVNAVPTENSELIAFSFYCLDRTSDLSGFNSTGAVINDNFSRSRVNPPTFRLPDNLPDGEYIVRFKIDWNNIEPEGEATAAFLTNGGAFADVKFYVGEKAAPGRLHFHTNCGFFVGNANEKGLPAVAPTTDLALRLVRPADCYTYPDNVTVTVTDSEGVVTETTHALSSTGLVTIPAATMQGGDVTISAMLTAPARYERTDYQMTLGENFDGPDHSQPNAEVWKRADHNNNSTWNRFVSTSDKVVYIEDGDLVTRCIPCSDEDWEENKNPIDPYNYREWMSGAVDTRGLYSFRYGRVDVRALTNPFSGSFPAIWMIPEDQSAGWPQYGEIDIWEMVNTGNRAYGTVHAHHESQYGSNTECNYDGLYHVYSFEWTPERMSWSIDGQEAYSVYNKSSLSQANLNGGYWPFDKPYYLILNQSVGTNGGWANAPVDGHEYETRFDFVHVYQTYEQNNTLETSLNTTNQTDGVYYIRFADTEEGEPTLYLSTKEYKDASNGYTYSLSTEPEGFYVTPTENGGFYIASTSGKRLGYGAANGWDCSDTQSVWYIAAAEAFDGELTTIFKNTSVGLGVDNIADGAGVFTDKPKSGEPQKWQFIDVTPATIGNLTRTIDALPSGEKTMTDVRRTLHRILKK